MTALAYYNEHDDYAAAWLRNLIAAGLIAPGEVDTRSITEVTVDDLRGFTQCHFFAGIGVWSHALRRAGWPDDVPVWTGSCPCQPFSAAGKQQGFDDDRHLWPIWFDLIRFGRPPAVLGEQVASALDWLDLVSADMEGAGYAFGASDLCAAGFEGAHIRQRLYFVGLADDHLHRRNQVRARLSEARNDGPFGNSAACRLADRILPRLEGHAGNGDHGGQPGRIGAEQARPVAEGSGTGGLADADGGHASAEGLQRGGQHGQFAPHHGVVPDGPTHAPMLGRHPADWLYCRDGKWRPVEPGTFPLVDEAPARVGRLRPYGNALDAETAAQFCGAVIDCLAPA